jgi:hypothetical protein
MAIKDFKVTDITSHRNGISGRPFWSVRFSFSDGGNAFRPNMLAVTPREPNKEHGVEVFVVDLNHPSECWRGDDFAQHVNRALVVHAEQADRAFQELLGRPPSSKMKVASG